LDSLAAQEKEGLCLHTRCPSYPCPGRDEKTIGDPTTPSPHPLVLAAVDQPWSVD
ncbi:hypothetical protein NHX12_006796, partial [Muraenolepis orangiensis]